MRRNSKPPTKLHVAFCKTNRFYYHLTFGKTLQDVGINILKAYERAPKGAVKAGEFSWVDGEVLIDGVLILDLEKAK